MVYGCDAAWWVHRRGLPTFGGIKVRYNGEKLRDYPDIRLVEIPDKNCDRLLFETFGTLGAGGNSGFQALNLAVQLGARRIVLVGFDMHSTGGVHWYGRNRWNRANNPDHTNFRRWIDAFNMAASQLNHMRVEVFNASPGSALTCWPRGRLEDFVDAGAVDLDRVRSTGD